MSFLEIILVICYTTFFSFLIARLKFFRRFHLSVALIASIFIFKVLAGIFYGYIHLYLYEGGDTYSYFNDSQIVFGSLKNSVWLYLRLVFGPSSGNPAPDIVPYKDAMMYYTNADAYLLVRFHSLLRLISFGYYNVHVVFYNFITLIGFLYLFRFFNDLLPSKKYFLIAIIFFFPSVAFWSSGMHKDGIAIADLGLVLFFTKEFFFNRESNSFSHQATSLIILIAALLLLFFVRNFLLLLLLPVLTAWIIVMKFPNHRVLRFLIIILVYFGVACNLNFVLPDWDFLNRLVFMQDEFKSITDGSLQVPVPELLPAVSSVIRGIPVALDNCMLQPWIGETRDTLQMISAMENIIVLLLLFLAIVFRKKKLSGSEQTLLLFCFFFAFSIFVVIGITVPVLGAIVRYKTPGVVFLLISAIVLSKEVPFARPAAK